MRTILALLTLSLPAFAQCFGTYPPNVLSVPTPVTLCNQITGGNAPFMCPSQRLDGNAGGPLQFSFSGLPDYPSGPGFFECYVAIGLSAWTTGIPVTAGTSCLAYVLPDIAMHLDLFTLPSGCAATTFAIVPPLPSLVGLPLYFQGFVRDPLSNSWATTNLSTFTL